MIKFNSTEHYVFSDESGWDANNRYGSIAMLSGSYSHTRDLNNKLKEILASHKKNEIKFKEIKNKQGTTIACSFLDCSINYIRSAKIKIHVLTWDKQDERHNTLGRCDLTNLQMMYYKNLKVVLEQWNHINTSWSFFPDEFSAIDWENDIIKYIRNTRLTRPRFHPELFETFSRVDFPRWHVTKELDSKETPILQLVDLYAGIIRTSRSESDVFSPWYKQKCSEGQLSLFELGEPVKTSKSILPRFEVMFYFKNKADHYKMGLNLSDSKYFKTFNKKNNIFIWHYEPQSPLDKAPSRK